jgi:hypothetical protein
MKFRSVLFSLAVSIGLLALTVSALAFAQGPGDNPF